MVYFTHPIYVAFNKKLRSLLIISSIIANSFAQQAALTENSMVRNFYALNHQPLYWFSSDSCRDRATEWLTVIESADTLGLPSDKTQIENLRAALNSKVEINNIEKENTDRQITGLVLNFIKELREGRLKFDYDEVHTLRDSVYFYLLLSLRQKEPVGKTVSRLDCKDRDYLVLKKYLHDSITVKDTLKYKAVHLAMNYRRYLSLNHRSEYIIVNIPAADAKYYRQDTLRIKMRAVVGQKLNPTPVIASYITHIVTFPPWNVPHSIATKEILPNVQKDEKYLDQNNIEVIDAKGNVIDDSALKWADYNENNFPYYFRQSTGVDNPLGILKFELRNPYSIFLHATSKQGAFANDSRFLSHGCIRLQKPFQLANALLRGRLNVNELKYRKKNTKSNKIKLPRKIPTFIVYIPVSVVGNKVTFYQDVYGVIK